ncbi:hypothetical protein HF086_001534 [Spodoptera exigua]|uniref:Uncharacterized protein n=1 Tax=Spodoptera exigua TaxID=7107 RepID=A0A922M4Q9_SPOEX|nr:hypothetical protein HF086_001534 [Spodoptera exigua]
MESVTNFSVSLIKGFIDSLRGVTVLLYLDKEINERALSRSPPSEVENSKNKQKQPKVKQESKVLTRVLQSCILNGFIFLLSILIFEYALLPAVKYLVTVVFGHNPGVAHNVWAWMQPFLSMTFRMIWVLPLFLLSKLVNSLWFQVLDCGCVFSIFFPVFILSGNEATPVLGNEYPLRLFSPVVAISNGMFRFVRQGAEVVTQRNR